MCGPTGGVQDYTTFGGVKISIENLWRVEGKGRLLLTRDSRYRGKPVDALNGAGSPMAKSSIIAFNIKNCRVCIAHRLLQYNYNLQNDSKGNKQMAFIRSAKTHFPLTRTQILTKPTNDYVTGYRIISFIIMILTTLGWQKRVELQCQRLF